MTGLTGAIRYREAWRSRLILQVEEEIRRPRIHGDGYQSGDGILVAIWRDAKPSDLVVLEYLRSKRNAEESGNEPPPPPPDM